MSFQPHPVYRAAWLAGGIFLSLVAGRSAEVSPDTAWQAYRQGNFSGSQSQYSKLAKEAPDDPRLRFNAGAAAYRQNDLTNATTWFESVLNAPDLKLQQQAYYNLGNTQFRLGENLPDAQVRKQLWGEALTNFVSAMKLDAADTNAAANYAFVRQQLEQLEQQLPPPQQQQQQQKKDQKDQQDQKKQDQQSSENGDDNSPPQPPEKDQDQDQQKQDNPSGGNQKEDQDQSGQPSSEEKSEKSEEKKSADEKKEPSESEGDQPKGGQKEGTNPDGKQPGEGQEEAAMAGEQRDGEMSEAQAVQMLEGQKDDEKALLLRAYGNGKEAAERAARIRKPW